MDLDFGHQSPHQYVLPGGRFAEKWYVKRVQLLVLLCVWSIPLCVTASNSGVIIGYVFLCALFIFITVFKILPTIVETIPLILRVEMCKNFPLIDKVEAELCVDRAMVAYKLASAMALSIDKEVDFKTPADVSHVGSILPAHTRI